MKMNAALLVTDLPMLVQEKILQCLSYAELSRVRSISKHFHRLCSDRLNRGYFRLEIIVPELQKQIKAQLPRRESERYKHPLSPSFDIISSLDSRIQWLKLTFGSAIQNALCCFYPGRLLDEIYSILHHLQSHQPFPNQRTVLQEARDMSSMAIEHFREHIEPKLQQTRLSSLSSIRRNHPIWIASNINTQAQCHHKRINNALLRRQVAILNQRTYRQNLIMKSQKYQMKRYRQVIHMRTKALINYHRRLKYLEKKSKASEQLLLEVRKDNDTLLQRFDQFTALYDPTTAKHRKVD